MSARLKLENVSKDGELLMTPFGEFVVLDDLPATEGVITSMTEPVPITTTEPITEPYDPTSEEIHELSYEELLDMAEIMAFTHDLEEATRWIAEALVARYKRNFDEAIIKVIKDYAK